MKFNVAALITTSLLLLAATAIGALAESLPDPTRPPETLESASGAGEQAAPTGLQSIIRREGARPAAIINGEYVVLGGLVGDARLVKIGEDFVTLKSPAGTETLKLMPGIEKTPVSVAEGKGAEPALHKKVKK